MRHIMYFWGDTADLPRPPARFLAAVREAQPGHEVTLFDRDGAGRWLADHAPEFAPLYDALRFDTARSDVFRLVFAARHGGWYLDYGNVPLADLTAVAPGDRALVFQRAEKFPGRVANSGFYAPRAGLDLFELAVARVLAHWREGLHRHSLPRFAGGKLLTALYKAQPGLAQAESFEDWFKNGRIDQRKKRWCPPSRHSWPEEQKAGVW